MGSATLEMCIVLLWYGCSGDPVIPEKEHDYQMSMSSFLFSLLKSQLGESNGVRSCTGGAGEMAQWLRAQAVLPEVLSSISSTHMAAYNHL